jgi:PAS domain S-box-containing protein
LIVLMASLSYLAASLAGTLVLRPEMVWPLWPGCAFVVAVLLLVPRKIWPILTAAGLAGFALYDWQAGLSLRTTAFLLLADSVEILITALGVSYSFGGVPRLNSTKSLARYSFFAVFLAPFWSASVATAAFGGLDWIRWRVGFFTEALAFLTVTPAVLSCVHIAREWTRKSPAFYLETVALNVALVLLGYIAFVAHGTLSPLVLLYSLLPLLLWSALRFGLMGISSSMIVVAFLSIWGAVRGEGPFTGSAPLRNIFSLQLFLFFASGTFLTLAVLVEQRKRVEEVLRQKEIELHEAQRIAQVGSWQWDPDHDAVDWSPELYRIAGRDPSLPAVTYAEHSHLYTPESWERLRSAVEQALEDAVPYHLDLQMRHRDGTMRWVTARGEPRLDSLGRVVQLRGTLHDITEQKRTEEALSTLGSRLIQAQEHERTRIARELHDDIGQRLAMLVIELEQLRRDSSDLSPELRNHIAELWKQTSEIAADTQTLSHELHSSKLELLGIIPAMRAFCREFSEQQKVEIDFESNDISTSESVPPDVSLCLFRVLQEALHNSAKHSGVRHFEARLWRTSGAMHLTVGDSGAGFDYEAAKKGRGLGLISMHERVKLVKGILSVESHPNRGTRVHACVPLSSFSNSLEATG